MVRLTVRKFGGDDSLSWAVLANGRPVVTGLSRREATYHRKEVAKLYRERGETVR